MYTTKSNHYFKWPDAFLLAGGSGWPSDVPTVVALDVLDYVFLYCDYCCWRIHALAGGKDVVGKKLNWILSVERYEVVLGFPRPLYPAHHTSMHEKSRNSIGNPSISTEQWLGSSGLRNPPLVAA
jgi:hypothetical protein